MPSLLQAYALKPRHTERPPQRTLERPLSPNYNSHEWQRTAQR